MIRVHLASQSFPVRSVWKDSRAEVPLGNIMNINNYESH